MDDPIYLIDKEGSLTRVERSLYAKEKELQTLIERHPELLPGSQIDETNPRRWLLIRSEAGIPNEEGGGNWWSVDHLLVDQEGVPTFVEVKRSTDTRTRREVVAQMLEYAANGTVYWHADALRHWFEEGVQRAGRDPDKTLAQYLGDGAIDASDFWQRVESNLRSSRVRCIFVADEIPSTLRRLVEFMNEHLDTVEVFAVELPQYVPKDEGGVRAIVPRLVGQTAKAVAAKTAGPRAARQWDEASFMAEVERRHGEQARRVCERLLLWAREQGVGVLWGRGLHDGSMIMVKGSSGPRAFLFAVWTYGRVEVEFQYLTAHPVFKDPAPREEMRRRLNQAVGADIPEDRVDKRPPLPLTLLFRTEALDRFLSVWEWVIGTIDRQPS